VPRSLRKASTAVPGLGEYPTGPHRGRPGAQRSPPRARHRPAAPRRRLRSARSSRDECAAGWPVSRTGQPALRVSL